MTPTPFTIQKPLNNKLYKYQPQPIVHPVDTQHGELQN